MDSKDKSLYDNIGTSYAQTRREDPDIYNRILKVLGDSLSVVNIGAGSGSYEPRNLKVLAIEPSETMIKQRKSNSAPVIKASANKLPIEDKSFDAAMTVLSLHHWYPHEKEGINEMIRVARKKIVIITIDPRVSGKMWLMTDYLKEAALLDDQTFPLPETICTWLKGKTKIEIIPIQKDSPDWSLMSFWAHPERVLDPVARAGTSGFSRQPAEVIQRVISTLSADLKSGLWDKKYGHLRDLTEFDAGLRIITAELA